MPQNLRKRTDNAETIMPGNFTDLTARLKPFINRERMIRTATRLVGQKSRTGEAKPALDELERSCARTVLQTSSDRRVVIRSRRLWLRD